MALAKAIMTQYGINAQYHKICRIDADWKSKILTVDISGWISQDLRIAGYTPIMTFQRVFVGEYFDFTPEENLVSEVYTKLVNDENGIYYQATENV